MGHTPSNETTTLLPHKLPSKPLKFPLGLVSEGVRPYLELIRLEKVKATVLSSLHHKVDLLVSHSRLEPFSCFGPSVRHLLYNDRWYF